MPKANPIRVVFFTFIVLGFMLGVVKLFLLRFEAGDVYPAYSSLRSDPLGSRAFYKSLENINAALVSRNYLTLQNMKFKERTAFFYVGIAAINSESVSSEWLNVFERLTDTGGRLLLSFLPVEKKPADWRMSKCFAPTDKVKDKEKAQQNDGHKDSENLSEPPAAENASNTSNNDDNKPQTAPGRQIPDTPGNCVSLKEQWGLTLAFADTAADTAVNRSDDLSQTHLQGLPESISWHTALYFDELEDAWRVIYAADGRPVIIERPFGKGSLVLAADSFFMSNEALRSERHPELLAWMIGESAQVVFDETHFGIFKHPGVLRLIKNYRFHWFIFGVAILALLFIWKNSVYFVPPTKSNRSQQSKNFVSDRESTRGLISLLRRNIPKRQLLQTCVREWERSIQPEKRFQNDKLKQIKSAFQRIETQSPKSIDLVQGYLRIIKIISKERRND
ncbi:MAG: hypothetical protein OET63_01685 [Desulfobacterales bacterium]|nr:hypothetical protein [Desulfobacterales bacterium]